MKKTTLLLATTMISGIVMFSGCASTAEMMRQQGYGPNYSQGYGDGCTSGKKAGGSMFDQFKKDVRRFDSNAKYKEGWNDGYKECRSEEKELMHEIESSSRDQAIRSTYDKHYRY